MHVFVVERYLPALTPEEVRAQARRETEVLGSEADVRHLRTTYLCDDELCFSEFEAPSAEVLREANERAAMPYERITAAVHVELETLENDTAASDAVKAVTKVK